MSRARSRLATIADVARHARVSSATVSRVLNRYPHVRPRVREAVLRAMRALGYRSGEVARRLARRETKTLGLIERMYRDVKVCQSREGTSEIHRGVIVRQMLKEYTG